MKAAYVYILKSEKDGKYYTGCSMDIEKRIQRHNSGDGRSTKCRGHLEVIYRERLPSLSEARIKEAYIKGRGAKRFLE